MEGSYPITGALASNRPATNGRLRMVYVYSDIVRGNVISSSTGTGYGGLLAVCPNMSQFLEPIVWQAANPLWQHLKDSPSNITIRLLDEDDAPITVYSDWALQLSFRISPQKAMGIEARKIGSVLKYMALDRTVQPQTRLISQPSSTVEDDET
eukprot:jgi/Mesvir1/6552/Mv25655-RA.1